MKAETKAQAPREERDVRAEVAELLASFIGQDWPPANDLLRDEYLRRAGVILAATSERTAVSPSHSEGDGAPGEPLAFDKRRRDREDAMAAEVLYGKDPKPRDPLTPLGRLADRRSDGWVFILEADGRVLCEVRPECADALMRALNARAPQDAWLPDEQDSPSVNALDDIVKILGAPEWEYPGQVVRDVAMAAGMTIDEFRARLNCPGKPAPWPGSDKFARAPQDAPTESQETPSDG